MGRLEKTPQNCSFEATQETAKKGDGSGSAAIPFLLLFRVYASHPRPDQPTPWTFTKSQLLEEVLAALM